MKLTIAILTAVSIAVVGCNPSHPTEPKEASVGDAIAAIEAQSPPTTQQNVGMFLHQRPPSKFVPASKDTRSQKDIDAAACWGFEDGLKKWRCKGAPPKTFMAGSSSPIIPSSWTVPLWVTDPANSIGCASDTNTGTSATCVGGCSGSSCPSGQGPLVTVNELIVHRWGTSSPMLQQTTDIWPISSETVGQERIRPLTPVMANAGSNFALICTPTNIGSTFSAGTVTAASRVNPGNDLKVASMPAGAAAGVLVQNITHPSYAIIHSMSGAIATMDQPLNGTTSVALNYNITENNSWTTGDTLQMLQLCTLNLTSESVQVTDTNGAFTNGIAWNSMIHVPDISGVTGSSTFFLNGIGAAYWGMSIFDPLVNVITSSSPAQAYTLVGCQFNGGVNAMGIGVNNFVALVGGDISTNFNSLQSAEIYGDAIVSGFVGTSGQTFFSGHIAAGATIDVEEGTGSAIEGSGGNTISLWGAGTLIAKAGGSFMNASGSSWVTNVKVNLMELADANGNAQTTGTSYAAGTWTDGVTINPTNLDANNGGLQNPRTGARFARQ